MKCKNCTEAYCPYRTSDAEKECYYSTFTIPANGIMMTEKWSDLRFEAVKTAMCGLLAQGWFPNDDEALVNKSVEIADKLMAKLFKNGME